MLTQMIIAKRATARKLEKEFITINSLFAESNELWDFLFQGEYTASDITRVCIRAKEIEGKLQIQKGKIKTLREIYQMLINVSDLKGEDSNV